MSRAIFSTPRSSAGRPTKSGIPGLPTSCVNWKFPIPTICWRKRPWRRWKGSKRSRSDRQEEAMAETRLTWGQQRLLADRALGTCDSEARLIEWAAERLGVIIDEDDV